MARTGLPKPPVTQMRTGSGWAVARQPGVPDGYRVLFRGQHVGWVMTDGEGWWWRTYNQTGRGSWVGRGEGLWADQALTGWQEAVDGLARTRHGKWIASGGEDRVPGVRIRVVEPGEWRPYQIGTRVWTPRPVPEDVRQWRPAPISPRRTRSTS